MENAAVESLSLHIHRFYWLFGLPSEFVRRRQKPVLPIRSCHSSMPATVHDPHDILVACTGAKQDEDTYHFYQDPTNAIKKVLLLP